MGKYSILVGIFINDNFKIRVYYNANYCKAEVNLKFLASRDSFTARPSGGSLLVLEYTFDFSMLIRRTHRAMYC